MLRCEFGKSEFMSCPLTAKKDSKNLRRRSTHEAKYLIGKRIALLGAV